MLCAIKSINAIFVDNEGDMNIVRHRALTSATLLVLWSMLGADAQCTLGAICHSTISPEDCTPGHFWSPTQSVHGCCPGCIIGNPEGATCFAGVMECGPGLVCEDRRCVPVDTEEERSCSSGPHANTRYPPVCDSNGDWAPVQCKGDQITGRCFCSDANGRRIFGLNWRQNSDSMTCACSRRRSELEAAGRADVTLHCTADGGYEPLQCDGGMCWCATPTGQATSHVVPEEWFRLLPCYDTAAVGMQYLRRCESIVVAHALIRREQLEHGTNFLGTPHVNCDFDGSYGSFQLNNGIIFCTNAVNGNLASFQSGVNDPGIVNCNCARDRLVYYPAVGLVHTADCAANGNYAGGQRVGDEFYCVDADGFRSSDFYSDPDDADCPDV